MKNTKRLSIILLFSSIFVLSFISIRSTHAAIVGVSPPSSGVWLVNADTLVTNEIINLNDSLRVVDEANLTIVDSVLVMNYQWIPGSHFYIRLENGTLKIVNTTITGPHLMDKRYIIQIWDNNNFTLTDSRVEYAGWQWGTIGEDSGIWVNTTDALIQDNNFTNNYEGLVLRSANNSRVVNNKIVNVNSGVNVTYSHNVTVSKNRIYDTAADGVFVLYSNRSQVLDNTFNNATGRGIYVGYSHNSTVNDNIVQTTGSYGLLQLYSNSTVLMRNKIYSAGSYGMKIEYSYFVNVSNNLISNAANSAVRCLDATHMRIHNNTILTAGNYGIALTGTDQSVIKFNIVIDSNNITIWLVNAHNNLIYFNDFTSPNTPLGYDSTSNNFWDNGTHGNYWSNYQGADTNGDGIGDAPGDGWYLADGIVDHYPRTNRTDQQYPIILDLVFDWGGLPSSPGPWDSAPIDVCVHVIDDIGVKKVNLSLLLNDQDLFNYNLTAENGSHQDDWWTVNLGPFATDDQLEVITTAFDYLDQCNTSDMFILDVHNQTDPSITLDEVTESVANGAVDVTVSATLADPEGIYLAVIEYLDPLSLTYYNVTMDHLDGNNWSGTLPHIQSGALVEYKIIVQDNDGHVSYYTDSHQVGDPALQQVVQLMLLGGIGATAVGAVAALGRRGSKPSLADESAPFTTDEEGLLDPDVSYTPEPDIKPKQEETPRHCISCGFKLPTGIRTCPVCGAMNP